MIQYLNRMHPTNISGDHPAEVFMKKFMKKTAVVFAALFVFASGFASAAPEVKFSTYGKITIGYYSGNTSGFNTTNYGGGLPYFTSNYNEPFPVHGFEAAPAIGFTLPIGGDVVWGCQRFAVEIQAPFVFGNSYLNHKRYENNPYENSCTDVWGNGTGFAVNPGAYFIWNYYLPKTVPQGLQNLSIQLGLGLSTSISFINGQWRTHHYDTGINDEGSFTNSSFGMRVNSLFGVRYDFTDNFSALFEWITGFIGTATYSTRIGVLWRF